MVARDRQLAGFTYGAFGAIQRELDEGSGGGGSGGAGPGPRPPRPSKTPPGLAPPTVATQGTRPTGGRVIFEPGPKRPTLTSVVSTVRPIVFPGVRPQPGRPVYHPPVKTVDPVAPSSSSGGGAYPFPTYPGSGGGAGVVIDPAPPAFDLPDLVEPTAPPASATAQGPDLNLKKLAVIGGVIAAGYLLLRKRQP